MPEGVSSDELKTMREALADRLDGCHGLALSDRAELAMTVRAIDVQAASCGEAFRQMRHTLRRHAVVAHRTARVLHNELVTDAPPGTMLTVLSRSDEFSDEAKKQLMDLLRSNQRAAFMEALSEIVVADQADLVVIDRLLNQAIAATS